MMIIFKEKAPNRHKDNEDDIEEKDWLEMDDDKEEIAYIEEYLEDDF